MNATVIQAVRFGIVGIVSNAIGFCLYLLLTAAGLGPKLAMSLLFALGTLQTFVFNRKWSFQYRQQDRTVFFRYLTTYGLGYLVNLGALIVLVDHARLPHAAVQGVMILAVAAMSFLLQKFWVFPSRTTTTNLPESVP